MMKKSTFLVVIIFCIQLTVNAQTYQKRDTPQRITLNLTETPANSMAVTWRTLCAIEKPQVQYIIATDSLNLGEKAISIDATTEEINLDSATFVYHYSAIMDNLIPATQYAYRVGGGDEWSEWNQFLTALTEYAPFKFIFLGDPQEGIKEYVTRVFRKCFAVAPEARFWLFSGDLMDKPHRDKEWDDWYYAGGYFYTMIPSIMVPGSHEHFYRRKDRTKVHEFTPL